MSSPKVISFVSMPAEEARAKNRAGCRRYLALARLVYDDMQERVQEMRGQGIDISVSTVAPGEAEAKTWAQFDQGGDFGVASVQYCHAYWQSLKHPHSERIIREHSKWKAAFNAHLEAASESAQAAIKAACEEFRMAQEEQAEAIVVEELQAIERTSVEQSREMVEHELIESIIKAAETAQEANSAKSQIQTVLEAAPIKAQRVLKLEMLRTDLAEQRTQRQRAAAWQLFESETLKQYLRQLKIHEEEMLKSLSVLSQEDEERFTSKVKALETLANMKGIDESERALEALQAEIDEAVRRKSILAVVKKVLRQQGYDAVEEMETITPDGIRANYFEDVNNPGRWVEVAFKESSALLSVELVKADDDESSTSEQRDHEAQTKLCRSMAKAEEQLSSAFSVNLKRDVAPGAKVKVKSALKKRKKSRAASAEAKQQARPI